MLALLSLEGNMATLTIRNLSDSTRQELKERAARHNRSMEAEVRAILETAVRSETGFMRRWVENTAGLGADIDLPERRAPREFTL